MSISIIRDSIYGIRSPSIKRMVGKDDNKIHISSLIYEEIRTTLIKELNEILSSVIHFFDYSNSKIKEKDKKVGKKHVYPFLRNIPLILPDLKTCKKSVSKSILLDNDCFYFPEKSFQKLIKEVAQDYKMGLKFSREALHLIQFEMEQFLYKLLHYAKKEAKHSKRNTIYPKDLQMVKYIYDYNDYNDYNSNNNKYINKIIPYDFNEIFKKLAKKFNRMEKKNILFSPSYSKQLDLFINIVLYKLITYIPNVWDIHIELKDIKYSLSLFPGELRKHALSEGNKALEGIKKKRIVCSKIIGEWMENNFEIGIDKDALIFLSGVIEYLIAEVIDLSLSIFYSNTNKELDGNDLYRVIKNDQELEKLRERLKIDILRI